MSLSGWMAPPAPPEGLALEGRYVRLEPIDPARHAAAIHPRAVPHPEMWTFMSCGPFDNAEEYAAYLEAANAAPDQTFFALFDKDLGGFAGHASFLRITPEQGTIELGNIALTPAMQRGRAATEAWALMMRWAFDAGYRRFEWKCDAANGASRRAALRLGFAFEGIHRQAMVVKGKNRDTAWYSIIDAEWPGVRAALDAWLDPGNFDAAGLQTHPLSALR